MTVIEKKVNVFLGLQTRVLDDDDEQNHLLREVFEMAGLPNVEFFEESQIFIDNINENIHLAIVDQVLKKSSAKLQGINVVRVLKERYPNLRIIFVSGTSDPKVLKEIIRLKPDGYVDKDEPDYMNVLVQVVLERLTEIKSNLELAMMLESYKNKQ